MPPAAAAAGLQHPRPGRETLLQATKPTASQHEEPGEQGWRWAQDGGLAV